MTVQHQTGTVSVADGCAAVAVPVQLSPETVVAEPVGALAAAVRARLGDARIWHVNSTATGGGVAELLRATVGRHGLVGLPGTWLVSNAPARYFDLTKRVHHGLHGRVAGGPLTAADAAFYRQVTSAQAARLLEHVRR